MVIRKCFYNRAIEILGIQENGVGFIYLKSYLGRQENNIYHLTKKKGLNCLGQTDPEGKTCL